MTHHSDEELIQRFHDSENPGLAFDLIVRKYQEQVYWHIRRLVISHEDANDIAQDVFIKAWKALPDFRGDSGLFTWLYRIATNEALSFLKKKNKRFFLSFSDVEQQLSDSLITDTYFEGNEIEKKIQQAILTLPEKQRVVFNLRYYDEMKYEEMSKILDTSEGALKASYHHAAKKIEKILTS
ncbi:MAG: sigma-70 family RNA polymerase sigma factor [Bacteroidales bacterium]|jgi:RNA polymerase sigma-70 factor (ECF subfamily)|nr:sigma-70 family RNA polymerase sigma factor [Bacteroidales bacterium]NLM93266.1 sigma-70 family RNA polymerase sigma factor [Bacteroidales bacterium]